MKISSRITAGILCAALCLASLSGCGKQPDDKKGSDTSGSALQTYDSAKSESDYEQCLDATCGYSDMVNYTQPQKGEEIVVMTIKDKGSIKIKLFPELLPKACANFTGLAQKGYYNGLTFHRIIQEFMIQGGDPLGSGMGGESVWGGQFDGGASKYLYHVNGALAYANSGSTSTDGSQFYIVVGSTFDQEVLSQMSGGAVYSQAVVDAYSKNGGTPWLDGGYTVFGQVFEGMELINNICNNTVTDGSDKPVEDVVIEKVEVTKY